MFDARHIFPRMAWPLVLLAVVVILCTVAGSTVLLKQLEDRELRSRAGIVAGALEASSEMFGSGAELMQYLEGIGASTSALHQLALVESESQTIVAATQEAWVGQTRDAITVLRGQGDRWAGLAPYEQVYALGVTVRTPSLAREYGQRYQALVVLDGSGIAAGTRNMIVMISGIGAVAVLVVLAVIFWQLQSIVLAPIKRIDRALSQSGGPSSAAVPHLFPDEIGGFADALRASLKQIETSQERLQVLSRALEASSNEMYVIDVDSLVILHANRQAAVNLGYTPQELQGLAVAVVACELDDPQTNTLLREQLQTGEISHRYTHTRKDGSCYPFEFKATIVPGERRSYLIVLGNDISERRAQEERVRQSEERMQHAMRGSNNGLFDYDIEGGTLYVSERLRAWLGESRERLPIGEFLNYVAAADLPAVQSALGACLNGGGPFVVEAMFEVGGATNLFLQARGEIAHVANPDGTISRRLSGFVTDVTRRKVAENLLHSTASRLAAVLDNVADGIVTLDHEGRICTINPAATAMLCAEREQLQGTMLAQRIKQVAGGGAAVV